MPQRDLRVHRAYLLRNSFIHELLFRIHLHIEYNVGQHTCALLVVSVDYTALLFFSVIYGSDSCSYRPFILAEIIFLTLI